MVRRPRDDAWWDDLWLNESFAEYASMLAAAEATRWTRAWTTFANAEKTWAYRQDQLPSTHPIAADIRDLEDVEVNFDGITYAKGASVLKQLVGLGRAGRSSSTGSGRYFRTHAWGNTTLRDLLGELEETSGRDLKAWSAEWLETAGVNTLRPDFTSDDDGQLHVVRRGAGRARRRGRPCARTGSPSASTTAPTAGWCAATGSSSTSPGARTEVPELVGEAPAGPRAGQRRRPHLRQDPARRAVAARRVTESIGDFTDILPRVAVLGGGLGHDPRRARWRPSDFVTLVLRGMATRDRQLGVQTLLRQAETAVVLYAAPGPPRRCPAPAAPTGCCALMRAADAGSDSQLQFARAFASAALTDEQLADRARAARRQRHCSRPGDRHRPALAPAAPLVAAGRADDAEIDAELDARRHGDRPPAGRRGPGRPADARRPRSEAWASVVDDDELPNAIQTAVIGGFSQVPTSASCCGRSSSRTSRAITDVWATRTNETAQNIVIGLFPTLLAEQATVDAGRRWLAEQRGRGAGAAPAGARVPRRRRARAAGPGARRPRLTPDRVTPDAARRTGYSGVSVCSDPRPCACSASARTPQVMPPDRSPAWNAEVIVIAAALRSGRRAGAAHPDPVTISTRRRRGRPRRARCAAASAPSAPCSCSAVAAAVALERPDVDRHGQLRLLPRQPDRPDDVVLLPLRERLTSGHLRHLRPVVAVGGAPPRPRRRPGR